jgi:hypothetical protein
MVNSDRSGQRTSESWLTRLFRRFRGDGKRSKTVCLGDRFGKIGELFDGTQTTWQVWQTVDFVDMPHAKLIQEEPPHRVVTVSLSTLLDKRFYRRLAAAADVLSPEPPAQTEPPARSESPTRSESPALPEPSALPEAGDDTDEGLQDPSLQGLPAPQTKLDQTQDAASNDDIIRFLEPESRPAAPKTNPFSKARIEKRRSQKTVSRITH